MNVFRTGTTYLLTSRKPPQEPWSPPCDPVHGQLWSVSARSKTSGCGKTFSVLPHRWAVRPPPPPRSRCVQPQTRVRLRLISQGSDPLSCPPAADEAQQCGLFPPRRTRTSLWTRSAQERRLSADSPRAWMADPGPSHTGGAVLTARLGLMPLDASRRLTMWAWPRSEATYRGDMAPGSPQPRLMFAPRSSNRRTTSL
jgi:hypothetical protein